MNDAARVAKIESILYAIYGTYRLIPLVARRISGLYQQSVDSGKPFPREEVVKVVWNNLPGPRRAVMATDKIEESLP